MERSAIHSVLHLDNESHTISALLFPCHICSPILSIRKVAYRLLLNSLINPDDACFMPLRGVFAKRITEYLTCADVNR